MRVKMAKRSTFCFTLYLLSVLVLSAAFALANKDPELKQCKHQCKVRQFDVDEKSQCEQRCEEHYREKKGREREKGSEREEEEEWGGRSRGERSTDEPEKHLRQCQKQCERQEGGQQGQLCRLRCQERYKAEREGRREPSYTREDDDDDDEDQDNPYVYEQEHFSSRVKTEHGRVEVLPKFTKMSELLSGLEKYRLAVLVANPQTFVVPTHLDADGLFFVSWGRGTITTIRENRRESFNVQCGDVITVHAGTPLYIVNSDENEKLYIVILLRSVNLPGHYEAFYGPGGENPESFFKAFSWEVLEAALKIPRDKLERLFEKQDQGTFVKASKEQIRALTQSAEGHSIWPFPTESRGSFNLFRKGPSSQSNKYGQLFEAELEDIDLTISYANLTKEAMFGPYYNSRAMKIGIVVSGEGHVEIACPHLSSSKSQDSRNSHRGKSGPSYKKVSSPIRTKSVFIVPTGHPVVTVASGNRNLEVLFFEVNAEGNIRYPLAGRKNIIKMMQREAKELAFNTRAQEVDQVFGNQNEEFFFQGPRWRQEHQGRADE